MASTMLALVYDRTRQPWEQSRGLQLAEVPTPTLDEARDPRDRGMALIKLRFAGFCGSDRGIWYRRAFKDMILNSLDQDAKEVRVIGHELLGEIVALGSEAGRGLKVGDTVSTESHLICGQCYQCRAGDTHVCAKDKIIGISTDGCFAEYVKLPASALWPTDMSKIRPEVGAVQEPFGNAVYACSKVSLQGKSVAIVGCGTIGLFAVAIARAMGARQVIGIEPQALNTKMALALGADHVLAPSPDAGHAYEPDQGLVERLRALTDGVGVDVALEMSGAHSALNSAISCTRRGGDVILFGLKNGDAVIKNLDRMIVNGISLHSVVGRRIFETWETTRRLLEDTQSGLHDRIFDVILNGGQETLVNFREFEPASFEAKLNAWPKVVFRF